jgi:purine-nucleoside phosphorylase
MTNILHSFENRLDNFGKMVILSPVFPLSVFREFLSEISSDFRRQYRWTGITGVYQGKLVTIIHSGSGAGRNGDLVLMLKESGCQRLVFLGMAGSLVEDLEPGDLFLAESAVDGEGFSAYWRDGFDPESWIKTRPVVTGAEPSYQGEWTQGRVFTTGSLVAETEGFLSALKHQGISAIDQETSAVYTAAKHAGISATALHLITDWPESQNPMELNVPNSLPDYRKKVNLCIQRGLELCQP